MSMIPRINVEEIREYITHQSDESKIYLGVDSERVFRNGVWFADYVLCVVVHIDGCHGAHIFGDVIRERDYDQRRDRPYNRLMTEAYKVADLYLKLQDIFGDREVEVHLDINSDEHFYSNQVVQQAVGYVKGVTQASEVRIKPEAFAASYAADRLKEFLDNKRRRELGEPQEDDYYQAKEAA